MGTRPISRCPGLTRGEKAFLRQHGIDRCYYARVVNSLHEKLFAVPLLPLARNVYLGYLPEIQDPCVIYISPEGSALIFDQFEPTESLGLSERQRNIALRYFNSACHSLMDCYRCAQRLLSQKPLIHRIFSAILGKK